MRRFSSRSLVSIAAFTALLFVCGLGVYLGAQDPGVPSLRPNQVGTFMAAKLPHVHGALDALATESFEQLFQNAQQLELLTLEEDWSVLQTEDYRRHSDRFRAACRELKQAATEQDMPAATMAYIELTFKCVQCHRHVRGQHVPRTTNGVKPDA